MWQKTNTNSRCIWMISFLTHDQELMRIPLCMLFHVTSCCACVISEPPCHTNHHVELGWTGLRAVSLVTYSDHCRPLDTFCQMWTSATCFLKDLAPINQFRANTFRKIYFWIVPSRFSLVVFSQQFPHLENLGWVRTVTLGLISWTKLDEILWCASNLRLNQGRADFSSYLSLWAVLIKTHLMVVCRRLNEKHHEVQLL